MKVKAAIRIPKAASDLESDFSSIGRELRPLALSWSRLCEQIFRVDKWSVHRGYAAMRLGSGLK